MKPVHPGRILKREIVGRGLSANRLAIALRVPSGRITQILNGKRGISAETALRLARYFGNSGQFWMNLQASYELAHTKCKMGSKINFEVEQATLNLGEGQLPSSELTSVTPPTHE
jgi:antitoxin HigA-1